MNKKTISRRRFITVAGFAGVCSGLMPEMAFAKAGNVPDKERGLVFLFQGDSITDGNWGRDLDLNHFLGHGYVYSIASRIGADFPQAGFTFHNRGISGNKISDLEQRWEKDAIALKPDVLSILIGVNDAGSVITSIRRHGRVKRGSSSRTERQRRHFSPAAAGWKPASSTNCCCMLLQVFTDTSGKFTTAIPNIVKAWMKTVEYKVEPLFVRTPQEAFDMVFEFRKNPSHWVEGKGFKHNRD